MTRFDVMPDGYEDKEYKPKNAEGQSKLIIPGELPTMNEIIDASKQHWAKYKQMKDNYQARVEFYAKNQGIPFFERLDLEIIYYRKNRMYDPDNIVAGKKFILDGLQKVGCIKNDGWKEINSFKETWKIDEENPRTEVILTDC